MVAYCRLPLTRLGLEESVQQSLLSHRPLVLDLKSPSAGALFPLIDLYEDHGPLNSSAPARNKVLFSYTFIRIGKNLPLPLLVIRLVYTVVGLMELTAI